MKTPIKKVAKLLILLAIILLFSCTKDPGYIDSKRLTKVYLDTFLLHQIEYDSQLKMISLETFHKHFKVLPDNSYWDYWSVLIDFEYEDGKLTKVNHDLGYDLLEYNSENLLSHVTLYTEGGTTRGEYQYKYDSEGYPIWKLSSNQYHDTVFFEYQDF